jgi:hypothetical protein
MQKENLEKLTLAGRFVFIAGFTLIAPLVLMCTLAGIIAIVWQLSWTAITGHLVFIILYIIVSVLTLIFASDEVQTALNKNTIH